MAKESDNDRRQRATEEAFLWLERLERILRSNEGPLLREWLKEPLHREAILSSCKLWYGPEILAVLLALVPDVAPKRPQVRRQRLVWGFFIAVASGALSFLLLMDFSGNSQAQFNSLRVNKMYQTPLGVRRKIELPDGSTMILNSATRVFISYGPYSRDVKLLQGEASFRINDDRLRRFALSTGNQRFEAQPSSRFNLLRLPTDKIELTVLEGQVRALSIDPRKRSTLTSAQIREPPMYGEHTFNALEGGDFEGGWNSSWKLAATEIRQRLAWQQDPISAND